MYSSSVANDVTDVQ